MSAIGLDVSGGSSLACIRGADGGVSFIRSAVAQRPASVLFPMLKREPLVAGEAALIAERGLGLPWPPVAQVLPSSWEELEPPAENSRGRVLIASAWHRLAKSTDWQITHWAPPDNLPRLVKPTPADCIAADARSLAARCEGASEQNVVVTIPNQCPEESQQALLDRLPVGSRLIWRAVAAAIQYLSEGPDDEIESLGVIDVGIGSIELSLFSVRKEDVQHETYFAPVRRPRDIHFWQTGALITDQTVPFLGFTPNPTRLRPFINSIVEKIGGLHHVLCCGPAAAAFSEALGSHQIRSRLTMLSNDRVAAGASLFGWRLARKLTTYFDQLPSLQLFTLTEAREPNWLTLIPDEREVRGGEVYEKKFEKTAFIQQGTPRVPFWLRRSGEEGFRKLTTDLPSPAGSDTWTDFTVRAASAGGFANVSMRPSRHQPEIFGRGQAVQLNWQSMERMAAEPGSNWPPGLEIKYGWPACGELYAYESLFKEFVWEAVDLEKELKTGDSLNRLRMLKATVKKTIAPSLIGLDANSDDAAPINQLLAFGSNCPTHFVEARPSGKPKLIPASGPRHDRACAIGIVLWKRLVRSGSASEEVSDLTTILGRMGAYAPADFAEHIASLLSPSSNLSTLFPAGRVLRTPEHGRHLFEAIADRASGGAKLNNSWLRTLVYVLYQRPEILRDVSRTQLLVASRLCFDELARQIANRNPRVAFTNSLRALALVLRCRRYGGTRDFLSPDAPLGPERNLAKAIKRELQTALSMRLNAQKKTLVIRLEEWLDFTAKTDEMPPIAAGDDDETDDE